MTTEITYNMEKTEFPDSIEIDKGVKGLGRVKVYFNASNNQTETAERIDNAIKSLEIANLKYTELEKKLKPIKEE